MLAHHFRAHIKQKIVVWKYDSIQPYPNRKMFNHIFSGGLHKRSWS